MPERHVIKLAVVDEAYAANKPRLQASDDTRPIITGEGGPTGAPDLVCGRCNHVLAVNVPRQTFAGVAFICKCGAYNALPSVSAQ